MFRALIIVDLLLWVMLLAFCFENMRALKAKNNKKYPLNAAGTVAILTVLACIGKYSMFGS